MTKLAISGQSWGNRLRREVATSLHVVRPRLWFFTTLAGAMPSFAFAALRTALYRLAGVRMGSATVVMGRLFFTGSGDATSRLTIGADCLIAPGVTFGLDGPIQIGDRVSISPDAVLYTATHAIGFGSRRMSLTITAKPVVIENGAWIGMHSLILPGVTIGRGAVVSAGSVVTQDVPPNTLVAGNPATVQQQLPFGNR